MNYAILLRMATRADFTDAEWKAMQEGITGAGMFVATVDRGFFDSFKEANALAHHLRDAHEHSDSVLIRDLATGHDRPFGMTASPQEIEQSTVATLGQAVAALEAKSPEDLPAYRQVVLDVAQSVAEAAKGVSPQENQALDSIRVGARLERLAGARHAELPVARREIQRRDHQEEGRPAVDLVREAHDARGGGDTATGNTGDPEGAKVAVFRRGDQALHS